MKQRQTRRRNLHRCLCSLLLLPSLATAAAAAKPEAGNPGNYCPAAKIQRIMAEELTASLDLILESQALSGDKNRLRKISTLQSAGTTLQLAASRGAAARITVLMDAILQAKPSEDYQQMLSWFPLLKTAMQALPGDDDAVNRANEAIAHAEAIMDGSETGSPLRRLRQARHFLACDDLDIPLQKAMTAQGTLLGQLQQRGPVASTAYADLLDSLRTTLMYVLVHSNGK